jgi:hypothetical protein
MNINAAKKMDLDSTRDPDPAMVSPLWPEEQDREDKLSSPLLREPRLSDGDLLHGDAS